MSDGHTVYVALYIDSETHIDPRRNHRDRPTLAIGGITIFVEDIARAREAIAALAKVCDEIEAQAATTEESGS